MTWTVMMVSSVLGLLFSGVGVYVAWSKAVRYQRFLPKRDVFKSLADLKVELEQVRAEWIQAQSDIRRRDELAQEKQELTERIAELRDEAGQLESSRRQLEDTQAKLDEAQDDLKSERDKLSDLQRESRTLEEAIESQRSEILTPEELEARKAERDGLRAALEILGRKDADLRSTLQELEANRQSALEELGDLGEKRDRMELEVRSLRAEVAEKSTQRDELAQHLEDLRRRATDLGGSTEALDDDQATALLWTPTLHANDFSGLAPSDLEEEKALAAAQERIREAGFIYHDRVLRAFHTSLKCAEDAPLTVLAGISGTGKSALPTKYAEAMGIHLATVPVQPSWDSPADLTGFYNHLEGRFRPTDLTRALIQLDYVHGPDSEDPWPGSCDQRVALGDQMLLVLLDEMNLARVEYYFSEFLSRLELRRGVADNDIVARRRSELILDLSASGVKGAQSLHVFVGRNVLFVGTMNEDESTQTLSDKVIDRSNLMRFGRPKRLQLDGADEPEISRAAALPRQTWSRWVEQGNQLNDLEASRLDGWIEALNDIVSKVGRPFAYRVSEAIRSYARQYPRNTGTGLEDSIADQVELRILPRLRGIDLHDPASKSAVDDLRRLVDDELGDADLSNALEAARAESGDQLFHWSGFDRS